MSRFARSVPVLAELTGLPIFARMAETGAPVPMKLGMYWTALYAAFVKAGGADWKIGTGVSRAMKALGASKRYRIALAAEGAIRHDENCQPLEPVSDEHRAIAAKSLEWRGVVESIDRETKQEAA